jgi:hypothetical protein
VQAFVSEARPGFEESHTPEVSPGIQGLIMKTLNVNQADHTREGDTSEMSSSLPSERSSLMRIGPSLHAVVGWSLRMLVVSSDNCNIKRSVDQARLLKPCSYARIS